MKTFFNYTAASLAVVVVLGISGCNSNSNWGQDNSYENASILLRIDQSVFETRAISAPILSGVPSFNTGSLFLVTSDGVIVERFPIVENGGTLTPNQVFSGNSINRSDLTSSFGVIIRNLPPSLRNGYVVVVGNTPITSNAIHISDIEEVIVDVLNQGSVGNVHLFGRAPLTNPTNAVLDGNRLYASLVTMNPAVARLEITNIVGMGSIDSFYVEGVFIDNFYRLAQVDGTIPATIPVSVPGAVAGTPNLINNAQLGRSFDWNSSGYPSAFDEILFDWHGDSPLPSSNPVITINGNPLGEFPMVSPGAGNVWSYQLFARTTYTTPPNIVFRLRDVVVAGTTLPNPQFVTISGFVGYDNNMALNGFRAGNIYHIPENMLVFYEGDLSSTPVVPSGASSLNTRIAVK